MEQEQEAAVLAAGGPAAGEGPDAAAAAIKAPAPPAPPDAACKVDASTSSSGASTPSSDAETEGPAMTATTAASSMDVAQPPDEVVDQQQGDGEKDGGGASGAASIVDCNEGSTTDSDEGREEQEGRASLSPAPADKAAMALAAPVEEAAAAAVPMETEEPAQQQQQQQQQQEGEGVAPAGSETVEDEEKEPARAPNGLTIAEAEEYLAAALACTDAGKRVKLVGKGLVALEATHEALGTSPEALQALPLHQQATAAVAEWRVGLGVGSEVDAQSFRDDKWYTGSLQEGGADEETGAALWVVKFKRFSVKFNEAYEKEGEDPLRFLPVGSHTAPLKGKKKPKAEGGGGGKKRPRGGEEEAEGVAGGSSGGCAIVEPELVVVGTTRSGRAVKSAAPAHPPKPAAKKPKKQPQPKREEEAEDQEAGEEEGGTAIDTEGKDFNDWVCGICDELERSDQDRLVLCDGPCHGAFHQSCLGLSSEEVDAVAEWFCEQCREGEHTCFVCGDTGKDDGANGGVHKCGKAHCGKFYHQHCLSQLPNAQVAREQEGQGEDGTVKFKFTCPLHTCDLCGKGRESGSRSQLYPCWHCPRAYHANCIPPTSKYHEYLLLCPDHAHLELPHLPGWEDDEAAATQVVSSLSGEAAAALAAGKGEDGWLAGVLCALLPRGKAHFRLPRSTFNDVHSKPKPYSHIPCIKYLCKPPPPIEPGAECQCVGQCDEKCLNRILMVECIGGGNDEEGGGTGKRDKYHNCNVGPGCGNRQFRNKEYIKHQIFKEGGCGWGLRTLEDVRKGELVFEYVGEVIDDELLERRLLDHARDHPNDHNMYIMELDNGYYLDARTKGNASRFINHSCAPNCELKKWNVKGFLHIGIMANQDIPAGTALSYDYQFATNEEGKFKCHCGAKTCRGSLAPKPRYTEDEEMEMLRQGGSRTDRKKLLELVKKRKEREALRSERQAKASALKKNHTSHLLPGDPLLEVRAGPPAKFFNFARAAGIFLVRNVKAGNDFLRRQELVGVAKAAMETQEE